MLVVFVTTSGTMDCDPQSGPAGLTRCILDAPYYSEYQCGTCLTDAYIKQISNGTFQCRISTHTYCYYPCMVEKYHLDSGPVYDDCLCDANGSLPQHPVLLPASCYIPDGNDCGWYRQCLARMYDCTGQTNYAINYGEKYCNLYNQSKLAFSPRALQWLDEARKCLQVALVPLLRLCREPPTCQSISDTAFASHVPCYVSPYQGFSVCHLPLSDWIRIFWTIKGSFVSSAFLKTVKASVIVAAKCVSEGFRASSVNIFYVLDVLLWGGAFNDITPDDELAHSIFLRVSSSLRWDQHSTADWYASADENSLTTQSTDQSGTKLRIQVIGLDASFVSVCRNGRCLQFKCKSSAFE